MKKRLKRKYKWYQKQEFLLILIIISCTFLLYGQSISFELVRDDTFHLHKNPYLRDISFNNIIEIWSQPYWRLYIPVTYTIWALLQPLGTLFTDNGQQLFNPAVYHFFNIFIHALNGILVFFLLKTLLKHRTAAFIGALIFIMHPIQVESVVWVSELRGLLSAGFGLGMLLLHFKISPKEPGKIPLTEFYKIILLILSVLSKPSAMILPVLIIIFDIYIRKVPLKKTLKRSIPYFLVIIPVAVMTLVIQPGEEQQTVFSPLWVRPLVWLDTINFYLYKIIVPVNLATSYGRTTEFLIRQWWFYVEGIIPLIICLTALYYRKKHPVFLVAFLIFVVSYLPVSGLVNHAYQAWSNVADRFIYLSITGIALAIGYLVKINQKRKSVRILAGIILLALFIYSYSVRVPVWKNELTLWDNAVESTSYNPRAYLCRADELVKRGQYSKSIADYNAGLKQKPGYEGYNSRGIAYFNLKQYEAALKDYNRSISLNPDYANAYNNRGNLFKTIGETDKALEDMNKAIQLKPGDSRPYINKGILLMEQNNYEEAILQFNKAYEKGGRSPALFLNRGQTFKQLEKYERAIQDFHKYIRIKPGSGEGYFYLAQIYFINKKYNQVIAPLNNYLKLNPEHGDSYYNRAKAYFFTGHYQQALRDAKKASQLGVQVDPQFYSIIRDKLNSK